MPVKCYNKPRRRIERKFTDRDAARVLCKASEGDFSFDVYLESLSECGGSVIADLIRREVENRILDLFCERLVSKVEALNARIAALNPTIRAFVVLVDVADGLVADLESIRIFGVGLPETVLLPLRRFVDKFVNLVDAIDDAVSEVFTASTDLLTDCAERTIDGKTKDE